MPKWVLCCPKCKNEFEHTHIDDVGMTSIYFSFKPEFPPAGAQYTCPACGYNTIYQRTDLTYRP